MAPRAGTMRPAARAPSTRLTTTKSHAASPEARARAHQPLTTASTLTARSPRVGEPFAPHEEAFGSVSQEVEPAVVVDGEGRAVVLTVEAIAQQDRGGQRLGPPPRAGHDGDGLERRHRRQSGRGIEDVVHDGAVGERPVPPGGARGGDAALEEPDPGDRPVGRLGGDLDVEAPRLAVGRRALHPHVTPHVDQRPRGARSHELTGHQIGREALADAPRIETHPSWERHRRELSVHHDPIAASRRSGHGKVIHQGACRPGSVVAQATKGVDLGRVEATIGRAPGVARDLHELAGVARNEAGSAVGLVESADLAGGEEAAPPGLELLDRESQPGRPSMRGRARARARGRRCPWPGTAVAHRSSRRASSAGPGGGVRGHRTADGRTRRTLRSRRPRDGRCRRRGGRRGGGPRSTDGGGRGGRGRRVRRRRRRRRGSAVRRRSQGDGTGAAGDPQHGHRGRHQPSPPRSPPTSLPCLHVEPPGGPGTRRIGCHGFDGGRGR